MHQLVDEKLRTRLSVPTDGPVDVSAALGIATELSGHRPGDGHTLDYLRVLVTLGVVDASLARIVEPHLDARAILHQAGVPAEEGSTWGVYAAGARGFGLTAHRGAQGWVLSGTKAWCSLAGRLSHAVVTAEVPGAGQQAFAVRLDPRHVEVLPTQWVSRGLVAIPSGPIAVNDLPATPLGGPGWYLDRPGFGWGGIGVAAVWFGIALGVRERVQRQVEEHHASPIALSQLGSIDEEMFAAQACLLHAAAAIDDATGSAALLAQRVRAVVARTCENTVRDAGYVLGPGPLVGEESYARRVADLTVYLRQHHGPRDLVYLGELVVAAGQARRG
ncbi:acyl-CoA dehydrogenase [Mycolicibacterium neoaurum]|uniref:acyl-CoA dehydrogenase n=1 Tax=Mycolicibacterium neoaurum TaxID=1795 RepID=UPI00248BEDE5|nr:acyl-CoA dehydrogenase [Mycolicibacterium neoaurum]WBP96316.1 acyl-CoA dehydrogenase [Mycolicibacterium neoaurum]WBS10153.1 acyl-CoA dehydrogenase [Mycolicibacterium neoaurum]